MGGQTDPHNRNCEYGDGCVRADRTIPIFAIPNMGTVVDDCLGPDRPIPIISIANMETVV
jgi:hypothetical protein